MIIMRHDIRVGDMIRNKKSGELGLVKSIFPGRDRLSVMNNHWVPTSWETNNVELIKK